MIDGFDPFALNEPREPTHPAAIDPQQLLMGCRVEDTRASGPGGQHRNKVQTAVNITHLATGVCGWASERRSRSENQSKALFRLRVNLAIEVRGHFDPRHSPSALWRSRTLKSKAAVPILGRGRGTGRLSINPSHKDFPSLLAEALDILAAMNFDPRRASMLLGVSPSQLVRFIKDEPHALVWVNAQRQARHIHALK